MSSFITEYGTELTWVLMSANRGAAGEHGDRSMVWFA